MFCIYLQQLKHDAVSERLPEQPNTSGAKNPGQGNIGHWTWVISPYHRTTIPKDCHKNTRCVSLARSISTGLTSQQIIQLDQLCYPLGIQLFKHPGTAAKHAARLSHFQ